MVERENATMKGAWALVTGGASGIGLACAARLATQGVNLVLVDLADDTLNDAARQLRQETGAIVRVFALDVTDTQGLESLAETLDSDGLEIDYLVTAAGILQPMKPIGSLERTDHDSVWAINYHGTYHSCRVWGERMFARGRGAIVTVSSITAFRATPLLAYGPAKSALVALTASLSVRYARKGVRINTVSPGFTATQALVQKIASGQRNVDGILANIPMQRLIEPSEVADAVAFLLSGQASAITGIALPVDAGWLAGAHWGTYEPEVTL